MSKTNLSREELIDKLAILEAELSQTQKLLEAPAKRPGWWKRFWGRGRHVTYALVILLLFVGVGVGQSIQAFSFVTGNYYLTKDEHYQVGYTLGVTDVLLGMAQRKNYYNAVNADLFYRRTKGMSDKQIYAIVGKYMKDNPQDWHLSMASLVLTAVVGADIK